MAQKNHIQTPMYPLVLVGTPVYSNKKYVAPYWIKSVKNLTYKNCDIAVVDNSKPAEQFEHVFEGHSIAVLSSKSYNNPFNRLAAARKKLNEYVLQHGYDYLMSIEQDIIAPPNIIERYYRTKNR